MNLSRTLLLSALLLGCGAKSGTDAGPEDPRPEGDAGGGSTGGGTAGGGEGTGGDAGGDSGGETGGAAGGEGTGADTGDTGSAPTGATWAVISGIYGSQYAEGVAVTPDGNVVFAASFENGIDLGDGGFSSRGRDDVLVGELAGSDGALVWNVTTGDGGSDVAYDIALAPDGSLYATGWFEDDLAFPDQTFSSKGDHDGFLARWERDGSFDWALQIGGVGDDRMRAVAVDAAGACVAGFTSDGITGLGFSLYSSSLLDGVVVCVDTAGMPVWGETLGAGAGTAPALAVAVDESSVRAGGYFTGEIDLGEGRIESRGDRDGWVKQWDRSGGAGTGRSLGATGDQEVRGLAATGGGSAVVGKWAGGALVDSDAMPAGGTDAFLLELDRTLTTTSSVLFGGELDDAALDVAAHPDGRLAITGYASGTLELADAHVAIGAEDIFIGVWSGGWTASGRYGSLSEDVGRSVAWHPSGDLIVAGSANSPIEIAGASLSGAGDRDFLVARISL